MKKKFLAFALIFALAAVAVVGGTMAYFTDKDAKDNTFTVGNVNVALVEQQNGIDKETNQPALVPFEEGKVLMPGINNAVDKIVSVKNTGSNDAYVRVNITVPAAIKDVIKLIPGNSEYWDDLLDTVNISDDEETGARTYTVIYSEIVAPDAVTEEVLSKVYLDDTVNYENDGEEDNGYYFVVTNDDGTTTRKYITLNPQSVVINVVAEAIQADGFISAEKAFEAYDLQK